MTRFHLRVAAVLMGFAAFLIVTSDAAPGNGQAGSDASAGHQTEFEHNRSIGRDYFQHKKFAAAIPFLEKADSINSGDYENEYELSIAHARMQNWEKARNELLHLLTLRDTAEAHAMLGQVLNAIHDRKAAAEQYQIAAHMEPTEDRIFDFGQSQLGFESDAAIKVFSYGVDTFPQSPRMNVGLGIAFYLYGDSGKAALTLCHAADLSPGDFRPLEFLGKLEGLSQADFDQVDQRLEDFLKLHPDHALANFYLGRNLLNTPGGQPSEEDIGRTEQLLRRALRSDPKLADAYFELGCLLERQRRPTEAMSAYERAITLEPRREKYHYRLAFVYRANGQLEKAKQEMRIFEKLSATEITVNSKDQ